MVMYNSNSALFPDGETEGKLGRAHILTPVTGYFLSWVVNTWVLILSSLKLHFLKLYIFFLLFWIYYKAHNLKKIKEY